MTVGEAEKIIRKIKAPKTDEEREKFGQAVLTIINGIQKGMELTDILSWAVDLTKEGDKVKEKLENADLSPEEFFKEETLMEIITNNLLILTSILSEGKIIDPEKDLDEIKTETSSTYNYEDEGYRFGER